MRISLSLALFPQSPATEPLIKSFWRIWSQDQLASKVFPVVMASRSVHRVGPFLYSPRPLGPSLDPSLAGLTHVPIKEGLQSIIKCLKAQDINASGQGSMPFTSRLPNYLHQTNDRRQPLVPCLIFEYVCHSGYPTGGSEKSEKMKGCSCSVCKTSGIRFGDGRQRHPSYWEHPSGNPIMRHPALTGKTPQVSIPSATVDPCLGTTPSLELPPN